MYMYNVMYYDVVSLIIAVHRTCVLLVYNNMTKTGVISASTSYLLLACASTLVPRSVNSNQQAIIILLLYCVTLLQ